jgi:hypothetical protein
VVEGEDISITVGSAGVAGVSDSNVYHNGVGTTESTTATDGHVGRLSQASYRGAIVCQGDAGKKGTHATVTVNGGSTFGISGPQQRICLYGGTNAANNASGVGDAVSAGGAKLAARRARAFHLLNLLQGLMASWRCGGSQLT